MAKLQSIIEIKQKDLDKFIELQALITEREGMLAENHMKYTWNGCAFRMLAERMRELEDK